MDPSGFNLCGTPRERGLHGVEEVADTVELGVGFVL
jgi:hypothetical protein